MLGSGAMGPRSCMQTKTHKTQQQRGQQAALARPCTACCCYLTDGYCMHAALPDGLRQARQEQACGWAGGWVGG